LRRFSGTLPAEYNFVIKKIFCCFAPIELVERFELIATTGKKC
jgi:hypothetical protein